VVTFRRFSCSLFNAANEGLHCGWMFIPQYYCEEDMGKGLGFTLHTDPIYCMPLWTWETRLSRKPFPAHAVRTVCQAQASHHCTASEERREAISQGHQKSFLMLLLPHVFLQNLILSSVDINLPNRILISQKT